jgi:thiol-disulfide isomerase/thioredoxin
MNKYFFLFTILLFAFSSCKKDLVDDGSGEKYTDLSLPDTSGTLISISDYDGSYRLIEFWASWCSPCRAENPNLVSLYDQYKDKNFIIIGYSLDTQLNNWKGALNDDQLIWPNASDLLGWGSEAVSTYDVSYTPYNVLIDPDGYIIGSNLKGQELANRLQELLGD